MKLINDLYTVMNSAPHPAGFIIAIVFKPDHIIYTGHFPGHPVTPGVVQLQLVHELLEEELDQKLKLNNISQCKFLKVLNPLETRQLEVHIDITSVEEHLHVKAWGENDGQIFFKLQAVYQFLT
ncbi:MAG TPA: 3-hydroxyacyl-ACP dehydratase [Saprospirales bacterium]|nr:3-hydroxyacyl-ACP dehydratase [Saprospirales bacterium]